MRIETMPTAGQAELKPGSGTGLPLSTLNEGDRLNAEVVSSDNGTVVIKADGGAVFSAKLDPGVNLSRGDVVGLEVTGVGEGVVYMSLRGTQDSAALQGGSGSQGLPYPLDDKSLLPYAAKLQELNIPVTESTARAMRDLMVQNPELSADEAAFLASNKLSGDGELTRAALGILSGGEKVGAMLDSLLKLVFGTSAAADGIPATDNSGSAAAAAGQPALPESGSGGAAITDLLILIQSGETEAAASMLKDITAPQMPIEAIVAQSVDTMQSFSANNVENLTIAGNIDEFSVIITQENTVLKGENAANKTFAPPTPPQSQDGAAQAPAANTALRDGVPQAMSEPLLKPAGTEPGSAVQTEQAVQRAQTETQPGITAQVNASTPAESAQAALRSPAEASAQTVNTDLAPPAQSSATGAAAADSDTRRVLNSSNPAETLAGLLSSLEDFSGVPASALERFSSMLLNAAKDGAGGVQGNVTEKLANLIDKLFTRIDKDDAGAGEKLKTAKEEQFARLSLIEETISRAARPAKAEMLEQTHKLIDHIRLLNNLEQYYYTQLPVKFGDERKTVEMYMFKKKGSKKADPENINILLALDLENLGHWEGLVNFRGKDVSVRMDVPGEREKEYFSECTAHLHEMLAEIGYKLVNTEIRFSSKETTPLTALTALNKNIRSGGIDLRI